MSAHGRNILTGYPHLINALRCYLGVEMSAIVASCPRLSGGSSQDAGTCDRKLPDHGIELALAADRAAEPAILLEMARRVRHHAKDVGVAVFRQQLARAIVVLAGVAIIDAGHVSPHVRADLR